MAQSGLTFREIAKAAEKGDHTSVMRCINGQRRPSIVMMRAINTAIAESLRSPLIGGLLEMGLCTELPDLFDLERVRSFLNLYLDLVFAGVAADRRSAVVESILALPEARIRSLVNSVINTSKESYDWLPSYSSCTCQNRGTVISTLESYGIVSPDGADECIDCAGGARVGIHESVKAFKDTVRRALSSAAAMPATPAFELEGAACKLLGDIGRQMRVQEHRLDQLCVTLHEVQQMITIATQGASEKDRVSILLVSGEFVHAATPNIPMVSGF